MKTITKLLIATAFSASVAAALTGAAVSGQSEDIDTGINCTTAHWPMIPAECLEGAPVRDVRFAIADLEHPVDINERFEIAFQQ